MRTRKVEFINKNLNFLLLTADLVQLPPHP